MAALFAFNRGRISRLGLARIDYKRTALSADIQTNWLPRILGSMGLRPGLGYTGASLDNSKSLTIPFVFSRTDTARIELTDKKMRVWVDDELVERESVSTEITNGTFASDLTGWTDADSGTAASTWHSSGYMQLVGDGTAPARRRQQVTVSDDDADTRHALDIEVVRGPVLLRVGSISGADDYIAETTLQTGSHSLAFTPEDDFYVEFFNYNKRAALVDSVAVASSGTMELTAPWDEDDLDALRWDQSGDVVFVAASGYRQRRIERRATDSWSVVLYECDSGPFRLLNTGPVTITPSATSGDITLTASQSLFRSAMVGTLFRITHSGQAETKSINGEDQFSDPIRITGVDSARRFAIIITGTWSATVTLQYSVGEVGSWVDATLGTYTSNVALSYDDTLDNQVIYYRIGVKSGDFTSGTVSVSLTTPAGSQTGIARITAYTSGTSASAAVLSDFGGTGASSEWSESYWSGFRGYPSSVAFHEGRLWWAGKDRQWGSVSDDFHNYDDTVEGDSGPINRSIGSGPVDTIHWLVSLGRLLSGADGAVRSAQSSSLDEPLTPTNFGLKAISTQGSRNVPAVKADTSALYVQSAGVRVYEAANDQSGFDYRVHELTQLVPEIGEPRIVRMAFQNQPERRLHCIRSDGTVAVMIYDKQEEVTCWIDYETDGDVEDVVALPGDVEDEVYYTVKRTINGSTVRYHEKFALESECTGFPEAKLADAFVEWSGSESTTITGLSALEGEEVVCWGWNTSTPFTNADGDSIGRDFGTFTVSGGQITGLSDAVTNAVVGLAYEAKFKSTKLSYSVEDLAKKKRIMRLGVIGRWLHAQGLQYGQDFDNLEDLPQVEDGAAIDTDEMRSDYDEPDFAFPGAWNSDSRVCLKAASPRPCTVLACTIDLE